MVETRADDNSIVLIVRDAGTGVPAELLDQVFEPFVTTKPAGRGTGLGLYVARKIVEEGHGMLTLSNGENGGTVVAVRLPRAA